MFGIRQYLIAGGAAVLLAIGVTIWLQASQIEKLKLRNENLETSVDSLQKQNEQAREAQAVAERFAVEQARKANWYDAMRESVIGGGNDAELPEWFHAYLRDLGFSGRDVQPADPD